MHVQNLFNRWIVHAYKMTSLVVLVAVLWSLGSYVGSYLFYVFNRHWVRPLVISNTDERVLRVHAQLNQAASEKARLRHQRQTVANDYEDALQRLEMEKAFQQNFHQAVHSDARRYKQAMAKFRTLVTDYNADETATSQAGDNALQELWNSHLIDIGEMERRKEQLRRGAQADFAHAHRIFDAQERLSALLLALDGGNHGSTSYDGILMQRELARSQLESQRAERDAQRLKDELASLDTLLAQQERWVSALEASPYALTEQQTWTAAFVPYANAGHVIVNQPVYGCHFGFLWCKRVGTITDLLPGEATAKHPMGRDELRGMLIRLTLMEPWDHAATLHLAHPYLPT